MAVTIDQRHKPIVSMQGIVKRFGAVTALCGMDLDVYAGEAVGLVGDNGAGKSTLVKILCGALQPTEGHLILNGAPVRFDSPHGARLAGIEIVYQDLALIGNLDVTRNIFLGRELQKSFLGMNFLDRSIMEVQSRQLMERLDIRMVNRLDVTVDHLSGGQRQSVAIARAVAFNPKVIILDEPTAALSPDKIEQVLNLIGTLKRQGMAVILISHRIQDIMTVCDRIVVMKGGSLVQALPTKSATITAIVQLMVAGKQAEAIR